MTKTVKAYLSNGVFEIGATFQTAGRNFRPGDVMNFEGSGGGVEQATVESAAGEFMIIRTSDARFECRKWRLGDQSAAKIAGHAAWTIYGLVNHTRP